MILRVIGQTIRRGFNELVLVIFQNPFADVHAVVAAKLHEVVFQNSPDDVQHRNYSVDLAILAPRAA